MRIFHEFCPSDNIFHVLESIFRNSPRYGSIFEVMDRYFMVAAAQIQFSGLVTGFQERRLPETATPSGYAALIGAYQLAVPLPRTLSAIGERHRIIATEGWRIMTPRHAPHPTLDGHLTFALLRSPRSRRLEAALLRRSCAGPARGMVRQKPTVSFARRIWFLL